MSLLLLLVYGLVALVWRSATHRRRTGDSGSRLADTTPAGKAAAAVMIGAHALSIVGVVAQGTGTFGVATVAGVVLFAIGLLLVVRAQADMGESWRVGVDPREQTDLVTSGLFERVRNPIFSGMALCLAGVAITSMSWIAALGVLLFVVGIEVQVRLVEEPYLRHTHGVSFTAYTRRTGRFVPQMTGSDSTSK